MTGKNFGFPASFLGKVENTPFYVSIENFWGQFFERKKNISLSLLDNDQKFFDCKNSILRVTRNSLRKFFWKKKCDFFFIFVYWTNFSVFCQRISHIIVKTESYVSTGNLGRKIIFFEKTSAVLIVFGIERTISAFWQNFLAGLRKLLSTCPWVIFENFFWKKNQTYFSILARWANPFRHSFEDFWAGLLENTILIFNHFLILSEKFPLFWRKKAVGLLKLLSTCLQEQFENIKTLEKKSWVCFIFFGN